MAKKVTGYIKLQIPAGKATPAPPVGPALGQHGVNIVEFTKQFNAKTADQGDLIIPVVITVYADRSFSFITKTPPAAVLLKKACNIKSGSGVPNKTKVATIKRAEVQKIAEGLIALGVKEKDNFEMVKVSAKVPVKDKDGKIKTDTTTWDAAFKTALKAEVKGDTYVWYNYFETKKLTKGDKAQKIAKNMLFVTPFATEININNAFNHSDVKIDGVAKIKAGNEFKLSMKEFSVGSGNNKVDYVMVVVTCKAVEVTA